MTASAKSRPDPGVLEVVRYRTSAIAEEMRYDLMRSARSAVLREAGDLSCALTDVGGGTVAQGNDIPMHLGVMGFTVRELLARVPAERLRPGDVYFVNLPSVGGNHLPDVKAVRPVFVDGRLCAFAVALAHWPDVGGALPGSYVPDAREIYQEGVQIPPVRLFTDDGECDDVLALLLANVRGPDERVADIKAQAATTAIAERRLLELVADTSLDTILSSWRTMQQESELRVRRAVWMLPDGEFRGEDALDDDGVGEGPVTISCRLTVRGERCVFDFSDSSGQTTGPVNTTRFITAASSFYAVKALLAPEAAPNAGLHRAVEVVTQPGTVCDAAPLAPLVAGNHETSQRIADAAIRALSHLVPERAMAAGMGSSGLALFSGVGSDGRPFFLYETHAGGSGASARRGGDSVTRVHMSNVMNTPAEVIEAEFPLRVERTAVRANSAGDGRHRGGEGQVRCYRVLGDGLRVTTMVERCRVAPPGAEGGEDGAHSEVWVVRSGRRERLRGKGSTVLAAGDLVEIITAGGGGFGEVDDER